MNTKTIKTHTYYIIHKSGFRRGFSDHKSITSLQPTAIYHFAIEFANLSEVDLGHVHIFCSHALFVSYGLGHKQTDVFTHCSTSLAMGATFLRKLCPIIYGSRVLLSIHYLYN